MGGRGGERIKSKKVRDEPEKGACKLFMGFATSLARKQINKGLRGCMRFQKLRTMTDSGLPGDGIDFPALFTGMSPCFHLHGEGLPLTMTWLIPLDQNPSTRRMSVSEWS